MTEPEIRFGERLSRRGLWRAAVLVGASLAIVVGAAVTMGASPSASPASPGATTKPVASGNPATPDRGLLGGAIWGLLDGRGRFGGPGFGIGGITITSISGSNISLQTVDGWTRTIAVTSTTTITKGGQTIAVGDLNAGDAIRFSQTRNADGSFTVNAIQVVLPSAAGTVTAKTATSITIQTRDGASVTIHVDGDTKYEVVGVTDADLGDVAVGMRVIAAGTRNADGSLDAAQVRAGNDRLRGGPWDHDKPGKPGSPASPAPSASPG